MKTYDLEGIKTQTDLLVLIGGDLKKVATTGGGEYAGACLFCGGKDRFRVQPNRKPWGIWMCRQCTVGKWKDAIDFVMMRDQVDFKTAIRTLGGGTMARTYTRKPQAAPPKPAYEKPGEDWQDTARKAVEMTRALLWEDVGQRALDWLHQVRGLKDETIHNFNLGYSPGFEVDGLWIPRGVVIPCEVGGVLWYVKIRTNSQEKGKKYICVKGSRTEAIYNADDLRIGGDVVVLVEGEIDCMTVWQEIGDVVDCVTFGSATNLPDLATWGAYLIQPKLWLLAGDQDEAGQNAINKMLELTNRAKRAPMPEGVKDANEMLTGGGDLWNWVKPYLEMYGEGEP